MSELVTLSVISATKIDLFLTILTKLTLGNPCYTLRSIKIVVNYFVIFNNTVKTLTFNVYGGEGGAS